jgi:hypothetical protein
MAGYIAPRVVMNFHSITSDVEGRITNIYFLLLDFYLNTMSNSSYSSTEKLDIGVNIKEPISPTTMNTSNDALKKKYTQIAFAVTLYWYKII